MDYDFSEIYKFDIPEYLFTPPNTQIFNSTPSHIYSQLDLRNNCIVSDLESVLPLSFTIDMQFMYNTTTVLHFHKIWKNK